MPRSRHRKPERPPPSAPGAPLAVTGKARNALKNALYAHPLPLDAPAPSSGGATQAKAAAAQQQQQGWAEWLRSLVPFARTQQEQRLPVVLGTWDPLTRCVWLQITPSAAAPAAAGPSSRPANAAAQSAAVRLLWERGFFGKGSLSRSEPTWRDRKANAIRVQRARERGGNGESCSRRVGL
jgi:tRNA-splicing endonuclease subunit Sen2